MENKKWSSLPDLDKALSRMEDIIGPDNLEDMLASFVYNNDKDHTLCTSNEGPYLLIKGKKYKVKFYSSVILNNIISFMSPGGFNMSDQEYKRMHISRYTDMLFNIVQPDDIVHVYNIPSYAKIWHIGKVIIHRGNMCVKLDNHESYYISMDDISVRNLSLVTTVYDNGKRTDMCGHSDV